jgi:hypothetical protein
MFCLTELHVSVLSDHHQVRCYIQVIVKLYINNYTFHANILYYHSLKLLLKLLLNFLRLMYNNERKHVLLRDKT